MSYPQTPGPYPPGYPQAGGQGPQQRPPFPGTPTPVPPPEKSKVGVVLGGIAAITVVLLGVGWTLYFTGFFGAAESGGGEPGSQKSSAKEELAYQHSDQLCQDVDWKPVTDLLDLEPEQATGDGAEIENEADYTNCHLDYGDDSIDASKQLEVFVYVFDSVGGAEARYEENLENPLTDRKRDAAGDWDQGRFWAGDASSGDDKKWDVGLDVQDANVSVHARVSVPGADGPEESEQALEPAVKDMLELLRK